MRILVAMCVCGAALAGCSTPDGAGSTNGSDIVTDTSAADAEDTGTTPDSGPEPADTGPEPSDTGPEPSDPGPEPADPGPEPADPGPEPADPGPEPADTEPADAGESSDADPPADAGPDPVDACLSEADAAAIESEVFYAALPTCPVDCATPEDFVACAAACYVESGNITDGCASCYAEVGICAVGGGCGVPCLSNPAGDDCYTCLDSAGCLTAFQQCSGRSTLIGPGPAQPGCLDAADVAIHAAGDVSAAAFECAFGCQGVDDTVANCTSGCLATESGLTTACADCYGVALECGLQWCSTPCDPDPSSPTCVGCFIEGGCANAFEQCAGTTYVPPEPP